MTSQAIRDYWQLAPSKQEPIRAALKMAQLEAKAKEKRMLIHGGKLIKPEEYPCVCGYEEAEDCYGERNERNDETLTTQELSDEYCWCPCHTYAGGNG